MYYSCYVIDIFGKWSEKNQTLISCYGSKYNLKIRHMHHIINVCVGRFWGRGNNVFFINLFFIDYCLLRMIGTIT